MATGQRIVNLELLPPFEGKHFFYPRCLRDNRHVISPKGFLGTHTTRSLRPLTTVGWTTVVGTTPAWGFELTTTSPVCHDSNQYTKALVPGFKALSTSFHLELQKHGSRANFSTFDDYDYDDTKSTTSCTSLRYYVDCFPFCTWLVSDCVWFIM